LPYRRAAQMLGELLPISGGVVSHATLRRHALAVGARRDPVPSCTRLIVAIDGTYVRSNLDTGLYQHHVVAGRIEHDGILAGRFAWIARWPGEAEQFMKAALQANGWTSQTKVVVPADRANGDQGCGGARRWRTGYGCPRTTEAAERSPPDVERLVARSDRAHEDDLSGYA
jgi:hypothetical protein